MLYLAEVHKRGFLNQKVILELLALQDSEQWHPVSGEEVSVSAATQLNSLASSDTLVLVDLNSNRQIQSIQAATEPVMALIKNAAQNLEKVRLQAAEMAEIEGWQESIQLQRLNTRDRLAQLQQTLQQALTTLKQQQAYLDQHCPPAQQHDAQPQAMEQQAKQLARDWQVWHQTQYALEQDRAELRLQASTLSLSIEQAEFLRRQIQTQANLYEQISLLAAASGDDSVESSSNDLALAQMPIETLSSTITQLQQDLDQMSDLVQDQEAELALVQKTILALEAQPESDSIALPEELAFERQRYQLLDETLGGQRRSLRERAATLQHHQAMLQLHHQGQSNPLLELLQHVAAQQQQQILARQTIIKKIDRTRAEIEQQQASLEQQSQAQAAKRAQLEQREQDLDRQRSEALWGQANARQDLQPLQADLEELHQYLSAIAAQTNQIQQSLAILEQRPKPDQQPSEPSF